MVWLSLNSMKALAKGLHRDRNELRASLPALPFGAKLNGNEGSFSSGVNIQLRVQVR
jgi:hypothetical protein